MVTQRITTLSKVLTDPRIDPRIKAALGGFEVMGGHDVQSREEFVAQETTGSALARYDALFVEMDSRDSEELASSKGLRVYSETVTSTPDGNQINLLVTSPQSLTKMPCVYFIHGGAMQIGTCFNGTYRAIARMLALQGVVVVMVDFRNCLLPSSVPDVAPFPAGLNDCVSGLKWVHANSESLSIDSTRIIVAGESGGGNFTLATGLKLKQEGLLSLIKGLYAFCPYIAGEWPRPENPSSTENNGILMDAHNNSGAMAYGIDAFRDKNPLAWPSFASEDDVRGLPPVVISVNECDPLRDEGIGFFRLLLKAGVPARCRQIMGTTHAVEFYPLGLCPEITRDAIRHIAEFSKA
jgi:acetyl esterase/lipase